MFSVTTIEKVFDTPVAISPAMQDMQTLFRSIIKGEAPWNVGIDGVPSLMLAGAIGAEVSRKVTTGLESQIEGSARADYLNEQYQRIVKNQLRNAVKSACDDGEIIFKPYMVDGGIENTIVTNDCYFPFEYNTRDELIDVAFGSVIYRNEYIYKLLERQTWDESTQTHTIIYKAFRSKDVQNGFGLDDLSTPIPLTDVPEWEDLPPDGLVINNATQPLFVLFRMPSTDIIETPQRQGLPIFSKAIDQLQKADKQEARTDWEFEGGELAIDASIDLFGPYAIKKGDDPRPLRLPKGKERLFRSHNIGEENFQMKAWNPDFRIDGLNSRMNQILRRIEFLCGLSYGILSDNNQQDRTAEEFRASKDRFFTTVFDIQQSLEKSLRALIVSIDMLADLQSVPQGDYEVSFGWDDSIMADRKLEGEERLKWQLAGNLLPEENRAWWLGIDVEQAKQELAEAQTGANEF